MKEGKKVFVGLSGGVDSAVSAALLKREGYEVTGVFIKAWTPEGYPCTWKEDRRSAMRAAAVLDIPFITLDLEKEYKKEVVDYMIREYSEGKTPNPDVMCNKAIKFGYFLKFALGKGANFVATGHYARTLPFGEGRVGLGESLDKNKDQSYFLWTLTQDQLKHVLFPVGSLWKEEVRKLAQKFDLPQATRKDSQGLCFLGKIDMKEFLSEYIPHKTGSVLNENGEIIGEHDGAVLYTIGERHGFRITKKGTEDTPMYVINKNMKDNTIVVASKIAFSQKKSVLKKVWPRATEETRGLFEKHFYSGVTLKETNWINGEPSKSKKYSARIRYRQTKVPCQVLGGRVVFEKSDLDISPGQSLVLYDGEICLGGGIIN
jgi:tRNA-specific 2-thiouridylase